MLGYLNEIEQKAVFQLKEKLSDALGTGLKHIILYGSKARGDFYSDSDIDLLVIVNNLNKNSFRTISNITNRVQLEYDLILSVIPYSSKEYHKQIKSKINLFLLNVEAEGIAV